MPGKPRNNSTKLNQVLKGMGRLSRRVEGLAHDLASFRKETAQKFEETTQTLRQETAQEIQTLRQETTQEFQTLRQEIQTLRQETAQEFQSLRQETTQEFQSLRQETTQEFQSLRQETAQRFDQQGGALQKQIYALADQIAVNERKDEKFRSDMLTIADKMLKEYELFHQEKAALGAGQDRLQSEVNLLQESDRRQNAAIQALDARVTRIESA